MGAVVIGEVSEVIKSTPITEDVVGVMETEVEEAEESDGVTVLEDTGAVDPKGVTIVVDMAGIVDIVIDDGVTTEDD